MSAFPKTRQLGFSLIELMVAIVILAILASVAVPSFQTWIRNSQIRNAAESITNGLQRARAEAVARNTNVMFVLAADSSWTVSVVAPALEIENRSSSEGSKNVTVTGLAADLATAAATITFNNLGGVAGNAPVAGVVPPTLAQVNVDSAVPSGNRNLLVTIGVGGHPRMCDPNLTPHSSPRAC